MEDVVSDDLSIALPWSCRSSWRWKGRSHVNLLEVAATLKLYRELAFEGGDLRLGLSISVTAMYPDPHWQEVAPPHTL